MSSNSNLPLTFFRKRFLALSSFLHIQKWRKGVSFYPEFHLLHMSPCPSLYSPWYYRMPGSSLPAADIRYVAPVCSCLSRPSLSDTCEARTNSVPPFVCRYIFPEARMLIRSHFFIDSAFPFDLGPFLYPVLSCQELLNFI